MSPRANKRLHLKIRIVLTRRMSVGEAREKLQRTVRTGIVQEGIDLAWIDWRVPGGQAGAARGGSYLGADAREALGQFYGAIQHPETKTRVEVIHEG